MGLQLSVVDSNGSFKTLWMLILKAEKTKKEENISLSFCFCL